MNRDIVSIYENIYNQELFCRNGLDNKFTSRLTLMLTLITAHFIIFTTLFFPNTTDDLVLNESLIIFPKILCLVILGLIIPLYMSFYRCFYRMKKNYYVMPTVEIRMFHFYIHKNNLCGTEVEQDLYNYLNDSYQNCAFKNAQTNGKREKALIIFDNIASICFILLIITYVVMKQAGYSINWIF